MNKLSKDKRNQLILIGMGTVGAIAGLWFLLLSPEMDKIKLLNSKIHDTQKEIEKRRTAAKEASKVEAKLGETRGKLGQIEQSMMPSGPTYAWVNSRLRQFNTPSYKVDMQVPGLPQGGPVAMLPSFPYDQLTVGVGGSAYYYDLGKFLADFENKFPCMRIQDVTLDPGGGGSGDEREKLAFRMDIVILTKNETP